MSVEWRERGLYEIGRAKWAPESNPSVRYQRKQLEHHPVVERSATGGTVMVSSSSSQSTPQAKQYQQRRQGSGASRGSGASTSPRRQHQQQQQESQRVGQSASHGAVVTATKSPERMHALVAERPPPLPVNRGSSARPDQSQKSGVTTGGQYETRPELVAASLKRRMQALQQEKRHMESYLKQAQLLDTLFVVAADS